LDDIDLEIGRPRTEAYIVYLFLMLSAARSRCCNPHLAIADGRDDEAKDRPSNYVRADGGGEAERVLL
jgi:hypothetical protein